MPTTRYKRMGAVSSDARRNKSIIANVRVSVFAFFPSFTVLCFCSFSIWATAHRNGPCHCLAIDAALELWLLLFADCCQLETRDIFAALCCGRSYHIYRIVNRFGFVCSCLGERMQYLLNAWQPTHHRHSVNVKCWANDPKRPTDGLLDPSQQYTSISLFGLSWYIFIPNIPDGVAVAIIYQFRKKMKIHKYLLRRPFIYTCIYLVFIETSASAGVKAYFRKRCLRYLDISIISKANTKTARSVSHTHADRIYARAAVAKSININKCDNLIYL